MLAPEERFGPRIVLMLPLLQIMLEMLYWSVGNLEQNVAIAQVPRAAMTSIVPVWLFKKEELEVPVGCQPDSFIT